VVRYVRNECWLSWDLPCASNNTTPLQHTSDTCESTMERRARTRDTNKGFFQINRLPRPRRPPPRHVLRQARGPEGRGSWSDLEVEQQPQTEEAARAGWEFGRRKKVWCDVRKGQRREWGLYYRAAANRRARCTYTATPTQADDDGRGSALLAPPFRESPPSLRGNGDWCFLLSSSVRVPHGSSSCEIWPVVQQLARLLKSWA
jgi:hypothetical protein